MSAVYTTSSARRRRRWLIPVVVAGLVLAALGGFGLVNAWNSGTRPVAAGAGPQADDGPQAGGGLQASDGLRTSDEPAGDSGPTSTPAPSRQPTPSAKKKRTLPPGAVVTVQPIVPRIEYFRVKREPECRFVEDGVVHEGAPVILEWKVTGADKVLLSVDGPGLYDEYGPTGSDSLPFPCEADPGTYQSHTYTLTAIGLGRNKARTLVVKAQAG